METLRDLELVRALTARAELRADEENDGMPMMVVRFSPFDTWYEINSFWEGRFLERTVKGAFAKTMSESRSNVKVMFNHGYEYEPGEKLLGVVEDLREDSDSAVGEVRLFDTSYNRDLLPGLEAGVYGSSFMFRVIQDEWNDEPGESDHNPKGLPERTIKEVRLFEFGPVTWPANPAATAGVRSATDDYHERMKGRDPQRYELLRSRLHAIRTPEPEAAREGTPEEGAATPAEHEPDTETVHHSSGLSPAQREARLRERKRPALKEKAA